MRLSVVRIQLLAARDEAELFDFEVDNREFFARAVGDRGDEYFARFSERHRSLVAENESGTSMLFLVRDAQDRLVGRVNVFDVATESAELGYRVAQAHGGRGFARAAVSLALEAAATRGLERISAMTTTDNVASRRVLAAAGFTELPGGVPTELIVAGRPRPAVHFTRRLTSPGVTLSLTTGRRTVAVKGFVP